MVAQTVKNLPSLNREDPLEKRMATPVFLPGKFYGQRSLAGYSPWGHKESDMTERLTFKLNTILPLIVVKLNFLLKYIYFKFKSKFNLKKSFIQLC